MTQAVTPSLKPTAGTISIKAAFQATVAPGAVGSAAVVIVTPTIPSYVKCDLGDIVLFGTGADLSGVQATAYVSAQNVIKVSYDNGTSGSVTPASSLCSFIIIPGETGKFVA